MSYNTRRNLRGHGRTMARERTKRGRRSTKGSGSTHEREDQPGNELNTTRDHEVGIRREREYKRDL